MLTLTNSEYHFSYFENLANSKTPKGELDINELIEAVKYGYLKAPINALRKDISLADYRNIKVNQLPAVSLSGIFSERNKQKLVEHSGLMQIDIDKLTTYQDVFDKLIEDPYSYVVFKSPGGKGIKVIVKINPDESTHLEQYYALEQHYKNGYDIEIDRNCKDVSRCMLLSYDPNIFCNPFSETFAECFMPKVYETTLPKKSDLKLNEKDQEGIIAKITEHIESNGIDITDGYENWIRIGYAISSSLGESGREYFHRISQFHGDYNKNKSDALYTNLNERNNGSITLGTLIYYARSNSINLSIAQEPSPTEEAVIEPLKPKKEFNPEGKSLVELLTERRLKIAKKCNKPAFQIFHNSTIIEMCMQMPETLEEFIQVKGVGIKTAEKYAMYFLPLIRKYKGLDGPTELKFGQEFEQQKSITYQLNDKEKELYERIRALRTKISKEEGIKPYWIFGNSVLLQIVKIKPRNKEELTGFSGIGPKKVAWFGKEIIYEIEDLFGK